MKSQDNRIIKKSVSMPKDSQRKINRLKKLLNTQHDSYVVTLGVDRLYDLHFGKVHTDLSIKLANNV